MTGSTVFEFKILTNYVLFFLYKSVFDFFRFVTMPRNRPDVSTMSMKYFTDVFINIKKKNPLPGWKLTLARSPEVKLNSVRASGSPDLTSPVGEWIFLFFFIF